jgi:hypothetical protein
MHGRPAQARKREKLSFVPDRVRLSTRYQMTAVGRSLGSRETQESPRAMKPERELRTKPNTSRHEHEPGTGHGRRTVQTDPIVCFYLWSSTRTHAGVKGRPIVAEVAMRA